MRLNPGITLAHADDTLRHAEMTWSNTQGASDRYRAYMDAVYETYLRLKQVFAVPDVASGLRSAAYWNLLATAGKRVEFSVTSDPVVAANMATAARSINQALSAEIETQIRALAQARAGLDRLKKLAARPGVPVVYDTNMLNHWRQPGDILWRELFKAQGQKIKIARLVIPLCVLGELDRQKYGNGELANKAATAIRYLERALTGHPPGTPVQLRQDATIEIWLDTDDHGGDTDRRIMQCAADLTNLQPHANVRLLTDDINMRLRAEHMGLKTMRLPQDHRKKGTTLDSTPPQEQKHTR